MAGVLEVAARGTRCFDVTSIAIACECGLFLFINTLLYISERSRGEETLGSQCGNGACGTSMQAHFTRAWSDVAGGQSCTTHHMLHVADAYPHMLVVLQKSGVIWLQLHVSRGVPDGARGQARA